MRALLGTGSHLNEEVVFTEGVRDTLNTLGSNQSIAPCCMQLRREMLRAPIDYHARPFQGYSKLVIGAVGSFLRAFFKHTASTQSTSGMQGYLAHKNSPPPRTLQQDYT